ncbi:MAG: DUF2284 domain-containing protein [Methanomassiliicoccus sp.]|nr:DUF2284 domain-containing protein [Methanomassiliicoccus sp.]
MSSRADLERLCEVAMAKGASGAKSMSARGVVVDPRVRMKCMVPLCANYGRNLMCPPNVMSPDELSRVLERYHDAILVQYPIPMDREFVSGLEGKKLEDIYESGEYAERMRRSELEFMEVLGEVERQALGMGYRFAAAFSGGPCRLCDECVGQGSGEACRHPFRSRPPMEALGIDVFLTARNAGLEFEMPPKDHPVWNGLVLID